MLYCGDDNIAWSDFTRAIEYLREIEKATRGLHEVSDARDFQIPGWFEHVSALGASLLVDAAGKVLHDSKSHTAISKDSDLDADSIDSSESEFEVDGADADNIPEPSASSDSNAGSENGVPEEPDNSSTLNQVSKAMIVQL